MWEELTPRRRLIVRPTDTLRGSEGQSSQDKACESNGEARWECNCVEAREE